MTPVRRSSAFIADYEYRFGWYLHESGEDLALRFERAVIATLARLSEQTTLGRIRHFKHPALQNLRSFAVESPFDRLLIFYRVDERGVEVWRLMHGARNLTRRLLEPND